MININIINKTQTSTPINFVNDIKKYLLYHLKHIKKDINLSIFFVSDDKIKQLNTKYRQKNSTTDVLSFPIYENISSINSSHLPKIELGDIFICENQVKKYKKDYELSTGEDVLTFIAIHAIKHLLGYHHK